LDGAKLALSALWGELHELPGADGSDRERGKQRYIAHHFFPLPRFMPRRISAPLCSASFNGIGCS
jgi:hypothetical protein